MVKYVSEERLRKLIENDDYYDSGIEKAVIYGLIANECQELNSWMTLEEFLKSGFVGKCWVFSENIVLETEYDTNGFWYVFKYIDQNTITHVQPIHKPEPPR